MSTSTDHRPSPNRARRRTASGLLLLLVGSGLTALADGPASGNPGATTVTAGADAASARPAARPRKAKANTSREFITVWNNNVENLERASSKSCKGDYADLVSSMRRQTLKPDIFIVQQLSGSKQLKAYTSYLSKRLGERYVGVFANRSPKPQGSPCHAQKAHQTNAVIYRARRFEDHKLGHPTWRANRKAGSGCANNTQDRSQAVKVQLTDERSGKTIVVASIHWPTNASGGPPCSKGNAKESKKEMRSDGYAGDLFIMGGDTNFGDRGSGGAFRSWYRTMNADLGKSGYRDVIYAACKKGAGSLKACLKANATLRKPNRIDYLFVQRADKGRVRTTAAHTLGFNEADRLARQDTGKDAGGLSYSDHKAVSAHIYY